jgi:hypothetical protein
MYPPMSETSFRRARELRRLEAWAWAVAVATAAFFVLRLALELFASS